VFSKAIGILARGARPQIVREGNPCLYFWTGLQLCPLRATGYRIRGSDYASTT